LALIAGVTARHNSSSGDDFARHHPSLEPPGASRQGVPDGKAGADKRETGDEAGNGPEKKESNRWRVSPASGFW
jgi:hypothetical protein